MVATPLLRNCNDMKLYLFLLKKNIGMGCVKGIKKGPPEVFYRPFFIFFGCFFFFVLNLI